MRKIGFSTGAIAYSDFHRALEILGRKSIRVVELSALRERELDPLLGDLPSLDLSGFSFVSLHVPSGYDSANEMKMTERLMEDIPEDWPVVLHPDAIEDIDAWRSLGDRVAIENMDRRKNAGRTVAELSEIFGKLPDARFCCDVGHARQIDTTMIEASLMLREFGERLVEVHVSEVDTLGRHCRKTLSLV